MRHILPMIVFAVAVAGFAVPAHAQSDSYPYSIMKPEPGSREAAKHRRSRTTVPREAEPEETIKQTPKKAVARRGSSNPVYPSALPKPENFTPPLSRAVVNQPPKVPPSMYVPQTGQTLPNMPTVSGSGRGGTETFQDRAARCTHQAGAYGPSATGDRGTYIGGCINQ